MLNNLSVRKQVSFVLLHLPNTYCTFRVNMFTICTIYMKKKLDLEVTAYKE